MLGKTKERTLLKKENWKKEKGASEQVEDICGYEYGHLNV